MNSAIDTVSEVARDLLDVMRHIEKNTFSLTRSREDKARIAWYRECNAKLVAAVSQLCASDAYAQTTIHDLRAQRDRLLERLRAAEAASKVTQKPRIPWYCSSSGKLRGWIPTAEIELGTPEYDYLHRLFKLNKDYPHA